MLSQASRNGFRNYIIHFTASPELLIMQFNSSCIIKYEIVMPCLHVLIPFWSSITDSSNSVLRMDF